MLRSMRNRASAIAVAVVFILSLVGMGAMWMWFGWMPEQKSNLAAVIDAPFYFVLYAGALLTIGVVAVILRFVFVYRRKEVDQPSVPVAPSRIVETLWVVLPTILSLIVLT